VGDGAPEPYALRVTTVFRWEDGEWKVVHRHADPLPDSDSARAQLGRLSDERRATRSIALAGVLSGFRERMSPLAL
jgi:hypothetical protein